MSPYSQFSTVDSRLSTDVSRLTPHEQTTSMQHTSHLLMIKPVNFGFNAETAVNNSFQVNAGDAAAQEKALQEFEAFVSVLRQHRIDVTVINDTPDPYTPDSIFPNNWISFHGSGHVYLYPMFAANRRLERKQHVLDAVRDKFRLIDTIDLSGHESDSRFLEGTGSMVLDRDKHIAYACLSPRTDRHVLEEFCTKENFRAIYFHAADAGHSPIYHTNVMMCVADRYVVICIDSIHDILERKMVMDNIQESGKEIISITMEQMNHFAGNMLQVHNTRGETFLVMSSQAYKSLDTKQVQKLESYDPIIHADLATIETNGGGSARCMLAEVFLEPREQLNKEQGTDEY
jgi:hypothetical protein